MDQRITEQIPEKVAADKKCQNAKRNSDRENAKIEHDKALKRVITALFQDDPPLCPLILFAGNALRFGRTLSAARWG
jgi:hypothetical protein